MSLLDLDLAVATVAAFGIGLTVRGSWRSKLGLCVLIAVVAWGLRGLAILKGDATVAGDYFSGLNAGTGAIEVAVAMAWTAFWCALGTVIARAMGHRNSEAR